MVEDLTRLQNTFSVREHTTDIILLYNKANIIWAADFIFEAILIVQGR